MKTYTSLLALAVSTQALQLEQYNIGENPEISAKAAEYDPERMSEYDAITGRGDTQEGADTRKNVLVYDDENLTDDQKERPMCHIGGIEDEPDVEGPSPECCRVYEYADFKGRQYDFCLYDVDQHDECPYEKYWQADTYGWHNEITSFWCGDKVGIRLCAHAGDTSTTTDKNAEGECRGANSNVIEDVGKKATMGSNIVDAADSIWVTKINGCAPAVVYEDPGCLGPSWFAYPDIRQQKGEVNVPAYGDGLTVFEGSWDFYDGSKKFNMEGNKQLQYGSSQSVKLIPYVEFETFFTTLSTGASSSEAEMIQYYMSTTFGRENAFTHRNLKDQDNLDYVDSLQRQCHDFLMIFGGSDPIPVHWDDPSLNYDNPTNASGQPITGFSNVFGIKVREMFFPEQAPVA